MAVGVACGPAGVTASEAPPVVRDGVVIEAPVTGSARPGAPTGRVEAWVLLAMPGSISMPARTAAERRANQSTIDAHQSSLLQTLAAWGAIERGRQSLTRSAVLVEVDEAALARIAQIPGVARVQKVTHLHRTDGAGRTAPRPAQPEEPK